MKIYRDSDILIKICTATERGREQT